MFRHRVRPPTPPLDEVTVEQLLRGAPIDDLPDAYQPLGQLLADARQPATSGELTGSAAAAAAFVAAHHAANGTRRRRRSLGVSVLFTLVLAASTGTAVATTQGALPGPIQQVAHDALGAVGISVPGVASQHDGPGDSPDPATSVDSTTSRDPTTPSPTTAPAIGTPAEPAAGDTSPTGTPGAEVPQGVAGDNPNLGPGNNSGNGNPAPGEGNQGNGGENGGGQDGGQPAPETPAPGSNLPPNSNGKGNGPPMVPPGQAKKT